MDKIFNILFVIIGGVIGVLSSIGFEYWKDKQKRKRAKKAILAEIKVNLKYLQRGEYRHIDWQVYDRFLEYVITFDNQIEEVITFYTKIKRHKLLGDEYRIKKCKYNQRNGDLSYEYSEEGKMKLEGINDDLNEIKQIGKRILELNSILTEDNINERNNFSESVRSENY